MADILFDPAAPIDDAGNPQEVDYYVEYVPPIVEPEKGAPAEAEPALPAHERIARLIAGMPGSKKLLLHIIDWCRTERTDAQIEDEIVSFQNGRVNVFAPPTILAQLERSGALQIAGQQADADEADAPREEPADVQPSPQEAPADSAAPEGGSTPAVPPLPVSPGDDDLDALLAEPEYLEVEEPPVRIYTATPEGLAFVEDEDPERVFYDYLDDHIAYLPIYKRVMQACMADEGATKKAIDLLVDKDPICKEPRVYSGHFIDRLEEAGAIAFTQSWQATDLGRQMMQPDGCLGSAD